MGEVVRVIWIVFIGTFFLGESVVLAAAALVAGGEWPLAAVVGSAFVGTLVSDLVWFRSAALGLQRWARTAARSDRVDKVTMRLDRLVGRHPHRALLFGKFLYGTRIAALLYMAARKVPLRRFIAFDALGTVVWLALLVPIGLGIGTGLNGLGANLKFVEWGVLAMVVLAIGVRGLRTWWMARREE